MTLGSQSLQSGGVTAHTHQGVKRAARSVAAGIEKEDLNWEEFVFFLKNCRLVIEGKNECIPHPNAVPGHLGKVMAYAMWVVGDSGKQETPH